MEIARDSILPEVRQTGMHISRLELHRHAGTIDEDSPGYPTRKAGEI
jgi:hypothetical protein